MEYIVISLIIVICILTLYMMKEARSNRVIEHTLVFSDLPESFKGMTLFFISDVHRRVISTEIISEINGKVDYILIGGDLVERGVPVERIRKNLLSLTSVAPVYFVWGNNDFEIKDEILSSLFQKYGVTELNNDAAIIHSDTGDQLAFVGVKDRQFEHMLEWETDERLDQALLRVKDVPFKILVSHKPQMMHKVTPEHQIQLVLCGHTHGGQIHLLGYSPYERGTIRKIDQTVLLISNGYGTTALPLRLGAKSETHVLHLK